LKRLSRLRRFSSYDPKKVSMPVSGTAIFRTNDVAMSYLLCLQ